MPPLAAICRLAPPADATPTSDIHNAAEELFCTRKPVGGTAPPNSVCAAPPAATVPLPSAAGATVVGTTGSGFCGPTGAATPAVTEPAACSGTRLPLASATVASACTVVLASFTRRLI